jgi:hypothetical protein
MIRNLIIIRKRKLVKGISEMKILYGIKIIVNVLYVVNDGNKLM